MNKDVTNTFDAEPKAAGNEAHLPLWLTGLLGLLMYWGCYYVDEHGGKFDPLVQGPYKSTNELASVLPADESVKLARMGAQVYSTYCVQCHQPHGGGAAGQAPPLAGSEWVMGAPARVARIPMRGLIGPIKVKGEEWNLNMLSFHDVLNDEQVAAVLTYVRNSWGNKATPVNVDLVKKIRAEVANHPDQFTAEELQKIPDTQ
ncbi:MAG TPA: cytochrome c [Candidatus Acidoferrum sp.]|nr:cytochrome c [Candidatus Acidoferrum sp.]